MNVLSLLNNASVVAPVAPRTYRGNMCGVRVNGLPSVPGGAADPSLVLSWFYDRYNAGDRAKIGAVWKSRMYTDVLLSWPDSRAVGATPVTFVRLCQELAGDSFRPCVMLTAKNLDPSDVPTILANTTPVLQTLLFHRAVSRVCVGWELSLWLSPTQVQQLIDAWAPLCLAAKVPLYVHFQSGYFAYQLDGETTADFWNRNRDKLRGIWHQRDLNWDMPMYQARITDCLQRFAGGFGFIPPNPPNDFIALEITAQLQFDGEMDEADGDAWGQCALTTPPSGGIRCMGTGNGA